MYVHICILIKIHQYDTNTDVIDNQIFSLNKLQSVSQNLTEIQYTNALDLGKVV